METPKYTPEEVQKLNASINERYRTTLVGRNDQAADWLKNLIGIKENKKNYWRLGGFIGIAVIVALTDGEFANFANGFASNPDTIHDVAASLAHAADNLVSTFNQAVGPFGGALIANELRIFHRFREFNAKKFIKNIESEELVQNGEDIKPSTRLVQFFSTFSDVVDHDSIRARFKKQEPRGTNLPSKDPRNIVVDHLAYKFKCLYPNVASTDEDGITKQRHFIYDVIDQAQYEAQLIRLQRGESVTGEALRILGIVVGAIGGHELVDIFGPKGGILGLSDDIPLAIAGAGPEIGKRIMAKLKKPKAFISGGVTFSGNQPAAEINCISSQVTDRQLNQRRRITRRN